MNASNQNILKKLTLILSGLGLISLGFKRNQMAKWAFGAAILSALAALFSSKTNR